MPNGGSDCCRTCWFNATNRGFRNWNNHRDGTVEPWCEIRDFKIEDPAYTYCANHPHRRPNRDRIPIGPVFRARTTDERYVWMQGKDAPQVREHLLDIVRDSFESRPTTGSASTGGIEYLLGQSTMSVVLSELVRLNEIRLLDVLKGYAESGQGEDVRSAAKRLLDQVKPEFTKAGRASEPRQR